MNRFTMPRGGWYLLIAVWVVGTLYFLGRGTNGGELTYTELKAKAAAGQVEEVSIGPTTIRGTVKATAMEKERSFHTVRVPDEDLYRDLAKAGVKVRGEEESGFWQHLLGSLLPLLLLFGFFAWSARGLGRQSGFMTVGKSNAKIYMEKEIKVGFTDVAGVDEAKEELREVIEFLRSPDKFKRLGGKLPKGILLVGPPGTGKTLLARAVAGEAGVTFFSISGSEFVEMFVGVGAARVRDLFTQAREKAPCIIFIDELDALGKVRGMGPMSHDEREQTLNQLLVELDGFDPRAGVILMAATNRPEILDPALLRAGRFDRHVLVDRPDKSGRLAILKVHARNITLADDADLDVIAAMTPGMVGADLANLVNEAALLAVRREKETVGLAELQEAVERVIAGLEKRSRVLNQGERERVAHHEVGHALLALTVPSGGVVQKISIIPRGIAALGYTLQLPTEDRFLMTQRELEDKILVLLGGRVAEELIFHDASTGAQDDLRKATDIARSMVTGYGMSRTLGHVSFDRDPRPFLVDPNARPNRGDHSEAVAQTIDAEVRRIVEEQYERAKELLGKQAAVLCSAAALLLQRETLTGAELQAIVEGRALAGPRVA